MTLISTFACTLCSHVVGYSSCFRMTGVDHNSNTHLISLEVSQNYETVIVVEHIDKHLTSDADALATANTNTGDYEHTITRNTDAVGMQIKASDHDAYQCLSTTNENIANNSSCSNVAAFGSNALASTYTDDYVIARNATDQVDTRIAPGDELSLSGGIDSFHKIVVGCNASSPSSNALEAADLQECLDKITSGAVYNLPVNAVDVCVLRK